MRLTINIALKLLYGLAFKDILSWPTIFWNQLHVIYYRQVLLFNEYEKIFTGFSVVNNRSKKGN